MNKEVFKGWTVLELILLFSGLILSSIVSIVFKSGVVSFLCSIASILTVLLQAKGKPIANVFGIVVVFLYAFVSYQGKLYGESIIYLVAMLPLFIISLITWYRNRRKTNQTVIAYDITDIEWAVVSVSQPLFFVGIYYFLGLLNTNMLLFSTFSFVSQIYALYLGARRCKYSFLWYLVNDVVLIVLWGSLAMQGSTMALPIIISTIMNCIYDVYAVVNWAKMNEKVIKISDLEYKQLSRKDSKSVSKLIEKATGELKDKTYIEDYTEFDKKVLYNENYTLMYGIYYKKELIGKSEILLDQERTAECKKLLGLEDYKVCQIIRTLDLEQFSNKKVLYNLIKQEINTVREMAYNYIIAYADPEDVIGTEAIKQAKFKYVKTATLESGITRDIYLIKF